MVLADDLGEGTRTQPVGKRARRLRLEEGGHREGATLQRCIKTIYAMTPSPLVGEGWGEGS
jgi:hypothetical protein